MSDSSLFGHAPVEQPQHPVPCPDPSHHGPVASEHNAHTTRTRRGSTSAAPSGRTTAARQGEQSCAEHRAEERRRGSAHLSRATPFRDWRRAERARKGELAQNQSASRAGCPFVCGHSKRLQHVSPRRGRNAVRSTNPAPQNQDVSPHRHPPPTHTAVLIDDRSTVCRQGAATVPPVSTGRSPSPSLNPPPANSSRRSTSPRWRKRPLRKRSPGHLRALASLVSSAASSCAAALPRSLCSCAAPLLRVHPSRLRSPRSYATVHAANAARACSPDIVRGAVPAGGLALILARRHRDLLAPGPAAGLQHDSVGTRLCARCTCRAQSGPVTVVVFETRVFLNTANSAMVQLGTGPRSGQLCVLFLGSLVGNRYKTWPRACFLLELRPPLEPAPQGGPASPFIRKSVKVLAIA